ncbi:unnamed protein product [Miscanthus lutarioriparius]|uniref:Amino acid transporter transmembrane domain-containing protein n=1 Tax=Miscanthus lutarioriparius TaxID=422564 RepID=A0A811MB48_9POAL|nr:unnamed protein product [Miscanthus lutarioriparius]
MAAHEGTNRVAPMEVAVEAGNAGETAWLDDDGRPQSAGTSVIGSGVLSLAWAIAQLGWVAGPAAMLLFALVTYYTATLLAECYRTGDPETGKRNYTYMDAVRSNLGGAKVAFCGVIQYANLVGVAIGYTIASSISMKAIRRAGCFHTHGHAEPCSSSSIPYMIVFGAVQIVFSQIPDFDQISWLSIVAAVMSFTYSSIGLSLGIAQTSSNGGFKGSLTGISIGAGVTSTQKVWHSLQAFGDIAFAYSFSNILIEIQDTIKAPPPSESKVMQKATRLSVATTTIFYMLCGCMGYAAFGDAAPDNLLTGFGFYEPFWLLDGSGAVHGGREGARARGGGGGHGSGCTYLDTATEQSVDVAGEDAVVLRPLEAAEVAPSMEVERERVRVEAAEDMALAWAAAKRGAYAEAARILDACQDLLSRSAPRRCCPATRCARRWWPSCAS